MTIRSKNSKPKRRKILTYDGEWVTRDGRSHLLVMGLYDGERYQAFRGIARFMQCALSRENRGAWFFAHFGGGSDINFFLEWFTQHPEYKVTMRFSGSAAVFVEVKRGKDEWFFVDSWFIFQCKLESIARAMGTTKGGSGADIDKMTDAEMLSYNENDCVILYRAIVMLRDILEQMGGELMPTAASSALCLFKRRFLQSEVITSNYLNDVFREAYIASRVEVFTRYVCECCHPFGVGSYDINASFPSSMADGPCPGSLIGVGRTLPPGDDDCFIADVTVKVPDWYIPPLPYRTDGRVFFPHGEWRAVMSGPDVRFAEQNGCLAKVHKVWRFERRDEWSHYSRFMYDERAKLSSADDASAYEKFMRIVYKMLGNALYGKHGEQPEKQTLFINPPAALHHMPGAECIRPGVWLVNTYKHAHHEHIPLAAHVTAKSRCKLTRWLWLAEGVGGVVFYCDTDSIKTTAVLPSDPKTLGALKHEGVVRKAIFMAPKLYSCDGKVRAKGFSRIDEQGLARLLAGGKHEVSRGSRVKELVRSGDLTPRDVLISKAARLSLDKRRFAFDGTSVPYHVSELDGVIAASKRSGYH